MASTFLSKKPVRAALIAAAAALAFFLAYQRAFETYELQSYDWRCQLRGARKAAPEVVLIDIWDDALKNFGAWPFNREYHGWLIQALAKNEASAIVFDVLFAEPKPGDAAAVLAAKNAGNVYFPYALEEPAPGKPGVIPSVTNEITPLLPEYAEASRGTGFVNTKIDVDGKNRRVNPMIELNGKRRFQLSFQVLIHQLGLSEEDVRFEPGRLRLGKVDVPLDDEGGMLISYVGPWGKDFPHYSYFDIVRAYAVADQGGQPEIDLSVFKGKICIIGLTSTGTFDTKPIPLERIYPMVGSYANVINTVLTRDFIRRAGRLPNGLLALFLAAFVAFASSRLRPRWALAATLGIVALFTGLAVALFSFGGLWIDLFYPSAVALATYAIVTFLRTLHEIRKREVLEGELKIASQIQQSFLPESVPVAPGLSFSVFMQPAKAVGGDLYTFVRFISTSEDRVGVVVGDVSGKGTPAALFMAKVVSEFKFCSRTQDDPAKAIEALNDSISAESTGGLFVTLAYGIFDLRKSRLWLASGGHLPILAVRADGESAYLDPKEGMPIGLLPGAQFQLVEWELRPGDCFAFYSDGVSEARNRKKEEYGLERLQRVYVDERVKTADAIRDRVVDELRRFMGKADQHDDMTLIVVKAESPEPAAP